MGDGTRIPIDAITNTNWIREKIDPEHTLPEVSLTISPDDLGGKGTWVATKYEA